MSSPNRIDRRHFAAQLAGGALQHQGQLTGLLAQARKHRQQPWEAFFLRQG